jgi:hypothetical protein
LTVHESRTLAVAIERHPSDVYAFAADVENLPKWAAGLGSSGHRDGDAWVFQSEQGAARVQFVPRNDLGVLDHHVTLPDGAVLYSPMRVLANGDGSHVSFTLFRLPGVTDEAFAADAALIEQDLTTLKSLLERP